MKSTGLKKNLLKSTDRKQRMEMVEKGDRNLSMLRQANLLNINRTSLYYRPVPIRQEEQSIKNLIDEIYSYHPEYGYRKMTAVLRYQHSMVINKKRVRRYMREMEIYGLSPSPNLSKRLHKKYQYPYLLRGLKIERANQVWSIDISYCRMKNGFMYMVAIIDWYSRYIVGYGLSNTLEKGFVIETISEAIQRHGRPEIMNSDQGTHFTSKDYIELLKRNGIRISMDGKGRALDNQRVERFFRSYKWEKLYLQECETGRQLRQLSKEYIEYYNTKRPHQSLGYQTPANIYYERSAERNIA